VFDFGMREVVASGQWSVAGGKIGLSAEYRVQSGKATSDQRPATSQSAAVSQLPVSGMEPSAISHQLSAFSFVPEARVAFRPRGSLRSFFTQYYRYARGDGKADLWRKRHAIRYATYLVAAPVGLVLGLLHPLGWMLLLGGAFVYLRQPYRRLAKLTRQPANAALIGSPVRH